MKKRYFTLGTLLVAALLATVAQEDEGGAGGDLPDSCMAAETRQKCKNSLKPFKYDAGKIVRVTFKSKPQTKEFEIPLYMGEKYRFVFHKEGLPQDVVVNVYNKKIGSKKRDLLYTSKGEPFEKKELIWEPEKSRKMFIDFDIPATTDKEKKGCVVFLLGYAI